MASNSSRHQPTPMPRVRRPFGEEVDGGEQLGGQHGGAMRDDHDRENEAQFLGQGGDVGGGGELLEPRGLGAGGEFAGVGVGVFRIEVAGDHDVVADGDVVEAECLAFGDDAGQAVGVDQRAGCGGVEADLHGFLLRCFLGDQVLKDVW